MLFPAHSLLKYTIRYATPLGVILLTHSMVQSPSWAANWFTASQEIPRISRNSNVRQLFLSWVSPIQSTYPHPTSCRSILILSIHLRLGLPSGLFPSGFPTKTLYTPPLLTHTRHMPSPPHSSRFYHPHNIGWGVQSYVHERYYTELMPFGTPKLWSRGISLVTLSNGGLPLISQEK
jgi:hypothetical protein